MSYNFVDLKAKARLYNEVGALMENHGFTADVPFWRRTSDETISSLFIENYRSGFLFYISLGVYVIGLNPKQTRKPKLSQMHAWTRLSQLTTVTSRPQIALKGDGSEDTNKMIEEVLFAVSTVAFKVLNQLSSLEQTKHVLDYYGEARWQVDSLLKEKLYGTHLFEIPGQLPVQEWEKTGSLPYQPAQRRQSHDHEQEQR